MTDSGRGKLRIQVTPSSDAPDGGTSQLLLHKWRERNDLSYA
jgi:hypothetical protein